MILFALLKLFFYYSVPTGLSTFMEWTACCHHSNRTKKETDSERFINLLETLHVNGTIPDFLAPNPSPLCTMLSKRSYSYRIPGLTVTVPVVFGIKSKC